jgi:hypothetical protein
VENIERLEAVYPHFTDIDLIIGGLAERPLSGILMVRYPEIHKNIREAGGRLSSLHRH